jgi:hypothetical protein
MVNKLVKFKYSLLIFSTILVGCKVTSQNKINSNHNIHEYLELTVKLDHDTVSLKEELFFEIIFKNKTDEYIYFYPNSFTYIDRYIPPNIFIAGDDPTWYIFNQYTDANNLIMIKPHEVYVKICNLKAAEPLLRLGENKLYVSYICSKPPKEEKKEHEILYGHLRSPVFEIFVKYK